MFFKKKKQDNKISNTRSLPGTLELLPADQIAFNNLINSIRDVYESFGFIPMDTPVIERAEILTAKVGEETTQEIYMMKKGDTEMGLRFDLTVPLARYAAEHYNDLVFPFRRYQIGKVYRGERAQRGRYREFYQCDIDIVGDGELSVKNDAEVANVIYTIFKKINVGPIVIKINNRNVLMGFLESLDLLDKKGVILRLIDKIPKIGKDAVAKIMLEEKISSENTSAIMNFVGQIQSNAATISYLKSQNIDNATYQIGVEQLQQVVEEIENMGVPNDNYQIDLSIARGLDYYTGTVFETFLVDDIGLGSICSGGRYDDLAEKYSDRKLPGVGVSIGLTRLFVPFKEKKIVQANRKTLTDVLVVPLVNNTLMVNELATFLRNRDIKTEIYLGEEPMKKKLKYANRLGIKFAIIIGDDEIKSGKVTVKNMESGEQVTLSKTEVVDFLIK